ncbi:hypothetical protein NW761_015069 [Fusarium oxysporum]|nr:hypothetical protein NW761_015069 [Fusarium oxysporum]KAJ4259535.1 hypothetical protein NW764_016270 [Fusarium oxysporum]
MALNRSVYSTDHSPSVLRTHSWRTVANSANYLIPHLRPDMKILDVGCGPGSITIDLARLVPQGHVAGIEYGVNNVSFDVGDIHSLPFNDDTFDVVHVHQVLQHIADPIKALKEMRRVTKLGGLVACRESASMTWYPESSTLDKWYRVTAKMAAAKGGNPHPGSHIHAGRNNQGSPRATSPGVPGRGALAATRSASIGAGRWDSGRGHRGWR